MSIYFDIGNLTNPKFRYDDLSANPVHNGSCFFLFLLLLIADFIGFCGYRYKDALGGLWVVGILFLCYVMSEVLRVSSSTWLSHWTNQSMSMRYSAGYYNLIYAALSSGQVWVQLNDNWLKVFKVNFPIYSSARKLPPSRWLRCRISYYFEKLDI